MSPCRPAPAERCRAALVLVAASLALVGCAGTASPGAPAVSPTSAVPMSPSPTTPGPPTAGRGGAGPASPVASLTVVARDGDTVTRSRLTCDPEGGDHPSPAAACLALSRQGERALPPVPRGLMCTELYGGPQTATVTGQWRGERVNSRLSRVNGCEIERWDALVGLLPEA